MNPTSYSILAAVCRACGVEQAEVLGSSRHYRVTMARAIAAYLMQRYTGMTSIKIAEALGRPNHSSVLTSVKWLKALMTCMGETVQVSYGSREVTLEHPIITMRAIARELQLEADAVK